MNFKEWPTLVVSSILVQTIPNLEANKFPKFTYCVPIIILKINNILTYYENIIIQKEYWNTYI